MERANLEQWKTREVAKLLALVETERRYYQEIVSCLPVGLLVMAADLSIVSANRSFRQMFGLRGEELQQRTLQSILPAEGLGEAVREVLASGISKQNYVVEVPAEEGNRTLRLSVLPIRKWDDASELEALLTVEDLTQVEVSPGGTETQAMPRELLQDHLELHHLAQNLAAMVFTANVEAGRFTFVNQKAAEVLGYTAEYWLHSKEMWRERIHAEDRERVLTIYQDGISAQPQPDFEYRAVAADGRTVWLHESVQSSGAGAITAVSMDVTEHKKREERNIHSQRNEALTKLASRIAHDFNNLLMIITGYGEEIFRGLPKEHPLHSDVQGIIGATERISAIIQQLLSFARRQALPSKSVDLNRLMEKIAPELHRTVGAAVNVEIHLGSTSTQVTAEPGQLAQVLTGLVMNAYKDNAAEAQPAGGKLVGTIEIQTGEHALQDPIKHCYTSLQAGRYATVTIRNPRRVIDCETSLSLFEPQFADKDSGKDKPLAMSRLYAIVKQWGGDIAVLSERESGTAFTVYLPQEHSDRKLIERPVIVSHEVTDPAAIEQQVTGRQTILFVEEEGGIRALVRKILRRHGYNVLEAENREEALRMCGEHEGKIDLLVTDLEMGGMTGPELVQKILQIRDDVKVLYVSGYTDDATTYAEKFPPDTAFLQKPFTLRLLLDKMREVLDADHAAC